jgi:hypothetical protein
MATLSPARLTKLLLNQSDKFVLERELKNLKKRHIVDIETMAKRCTITEDRHIDRLQRVNAKFKKDYKLLSEEYHEHKEDSKEVLKRYTTLRESWKKYTLNSKHCAQNNSKKIANGKNIIESLKKELKDRNNLLDTCNKKLQKIINNKNFKAELKQKISNRSSRSGRGVPRKRLNL